jgi:lipopolysaccharide biosynthesis protein
MTDEEHARWIHFTQDTELGAMWWKYHNAMIDFWGASGDGAASPAEAERLREDLETATTPFRAKLMELAGA